MDPVIVAGAGPVGLTLAPFAGHLIAALVVGDEAPFDIEAYRPDRFSAG